MYWRKSPTSTLDGPQKLQKSIWDGFLVSDLNEISRGLDKFALLRLAPVIEAGNYLNRPPREGDVFDRSSLVCTSRFALKWYRQPPPTCLFCLSEFIHQDLYLHDHDSTIYRYGVSNNIIFYLPPSLKLRLSQNAWPKTSYILACPGWCGRGD